MTDGLPGDYETENPQAVSGSRQERLVIWTDVRDALPERLDIYLLSSRCHPSMTKGIEEEGDSVIIGLYEGNGKWRRRNAIYRAGTHITAWADVPAGYS